MKHIYLILVPLLTLLFIGCKEKQVVSIDELMRAQAITPFTIELPQAISHQDLIKVELYDENGVIFSTALESNFIPEDIIKIFLFEKDDYSISLIHNTSSWTNIKLPLQGNKLIGTRGDISLGEPFVAFGETNTLSWLHPKDGLIFLRLKMNSSEPVGGDQ